ncbi:MAG: c-type cytochrome [Gaiellaceae bacterium]
MVALAASGCGAVGRDTNGDASHGKQLFLAATSQCASCHTLADAKSTGTIGPNLDDAFSSDKAQGFSEQTIADVVRSQIAYPEQPMPANLLHGQDARDVATYVAKCSANPNCGVTASKEALPGSTTSATTTTATTTTGGGGAAGGSAAAAGKTVFASAGCANCHTLKDAGSTGTVGPDLDQLKPSEPVVQHQVEVGGGAMPSFKSQLSATQIKDVATYVSSVAGK